MKMLTIFKSNRLRDAIIVFLGVFIFTPLLACLIFMVGDIILSLIGNLIFNAKLSIQEITDWLLGAVTASLQSVFIDMFLPATMLAVITWRFGFFSKKSVFISVLTNFLLLLVARFIFIRLTRMHFFVDWTADLDFELWKMAYVVVAILIIRHFLILKNVIRFPAK
jgi:hypothetical protein